MKTFIDGRGKDGCTFYRLSQPGRILKEQYPHLFTVMELGDNPMGGDVMISHADAVWLGKGVPLEGADYVERLHGAGKLIFFDLDDNLFRVSPYNEAYGVLGTKEIPGLWKDGVADFDSARNANTLICLMELLQKVDGVSVTTRHLAELYAKFNPRTVVLPNCIDFRRWPLVEMQKNRNQVRIGYQGGASHYEDMWVIKEGMEGLAKEMGDRLKLVWLGEIFPTIIKAWDPGQVELYPWVHVEAHSYRMALMNLDIGLVPLADTVFNHGKSVVKWMEYSALKIPTVVSDVPPYNLVVKHGETGFLAGSEGEFIHYLRKLIDDPLLRADMGRRAYEQVYREFNAETRAGDWVKAVEWMAEGAESDERAVAG